MPEPRPGLLISFEGPEGSGKSTLIDSLKGILHDLGRDPLVLREPGGTTVGERIRSVLLDGDLPELRPETELLLMMASRAQLVRERVEPALATGRLVICDRYLDASVAYQGGGRGLDRDRIDDLNVFAVDAALPDLTFLCLLPPEMGRERTAHRRQDRLEKASVDFHDRVHAAYRGMAESGDPRYVVVDARTSPEEMLAQTIRSLRKLEHELLVGL